MEITTPSIRDLKSELDPQTVIEDTVLDQINPWEFQQPQFDPEQIFEQMVEYQTGGVAKFFYMPDATVVYATLNSPWVWEIYVFSKERNGFRLIRNLKLLEKDIETNYQMVKKLHCQISSERWIPILQKLGWKLEGVKRKSFMSPIGILQDTMIWGKQLNIKKGN